MLSLVKPPHCLLFLFGLFVCCCCLLLVYSFFFFYKMWYFCDYIDITLLDSQEKMSVSCTSETIIPKMKWQNPQNRVFTIELSRGCLHANIFLFSTQLGSSLREKPLHSQFVWTFVRFLHMEDNCCRIYQAYNGVVTRGGR